MIDIENVHCAVSDTFSLSIGNLHVPDDSISFLKGTNGSGKSSVLRLCLNLIANYKGSVQVGNIDAKSDVAQKQIASFIGKERMMDFLTPKEYLMLVGTSYGLSKKEVEDEYHRIDAYFNRKYVDERKIIFEFSEGNKQLIGLYAAFISKRNVILLDEPFNFLDDETVKLVCDFFTDWKKQTKGTLFITSNRTQHLPVEVDTEFLIENGVIR